MDTQSIIDNFKYRFDIVITSNLIDQYLNKGLIQSPHIYKRRAAGEVYFAWDMNIIGEIYSPWKLSRMGYNYEEIKGAHDISIDNDKLRSILILYCDLNIKYKEKLQSVMDSIDSFSEYFQDDQVIALKYHLYREKINRGFHPDEVINVYIMEREIRMNHIFGKIF